MIYFIFYCAFLATLMLHLFVDIFGSIHILETHKINCFSSDPYKQKINSHDSGNEPKIPHHKLMASEKQKKFKVLSHRSGKVDENEEEKTHHRKK